MQQTSILDTCDFFSNEDPFMHQYEEKCAYQDHHQRPSIQTLLKYAPPDLITPEDNVMTSFDGVLDGASPPLMSSYLQYLKDPAASSAPPAQLAPSMDTFQWPVLPQEQEWVDMGIMENGASVLYSDANPMLQDGLALPPDHWLCTPLEGCFTMQPQQNHRPSIDPCLYGDGLQQGTSNGMTREYVSLSDINSFVAETDSQKHSMHISYSTPENLQLLGADDYADEAAAGYPWLGLSSFASVPVSLNHQQQLDSDTESSSTSSDHLKAALAGSHCAKDALSPFCPGISSKKRKPKSQHRILKRSADSISTLLSRQRITSDAENDDGDFVEDDDASDQSFQLSHVGARASVARKGRNVDKACNHCKRSHLRCDNMRPCRRCVATGKVGCKDVEHKPRGRPRLNKNQTTKSKRAAA